MAIASPNLNDRDGEQDLLAKGLAIMKRRWPDGFQAEDIADFVNDGLVLHQLFSMPIAHTLTKDRR